MRVPASTRSSGPDRPAVGDDVRRADDQRHVIGAGIGGGYFSPSSSRAVRPARSVVVHRASRACPTSYISMVKAVVFGCLAAIVGAYRALSAGGGLSGSDGPSTSR